MAKLPIRRGTDPPIEPLDGTSQWLESDPALLTHDPAMAGVIVRIGMAVNALTVHLHWGYAASLEEADAVRQRDNLVSLVMAASLTFEAIKLARKSQGRLRPLLLRAGGKADLLLRMGTLLREKHPASGVLKRARNSLGFHWDYEDKFLGPIIGEFAKNEMIIWVEEVPSPKRDTVHRLASEVLAHAVLPEVSLQSDPSEQFKSGKSAIADVIDAMNIIAEYFTAVVVAYLREQGVTTVVAA